MKISGLKYSYHRGDKLCIFCSSLVPLSDPTWFAPVINYVKSIAEHMKNDPNNYLVLLIITDGGIEGIKCIIC